MERPQARTGERFLTNHVPSRNQVTVSPSASRVLVVSTANDTLWVLDVDNEDDSNGGCAVLELQV